MGDKCTTKQFYIIRVGSEAKLSIGQLYNSVFKSRSEELKKKERKKERRKVTYDDTFKRAHNWWKGSWQWLHL